MERDAESLGDSFLNNNHATNLSEEILQSSSNKVKSNNNRLLALDLFRGFIICIMAWDHTKWQFTIDRDLPPGGFEMWEGKYQYYDNSPIKFLARTISHICAPGFFFTMGISMVLFTKNRMKTLHWSWSNILLYYFSRGCVLLLIDYLVDFPGILPKIVDVLNGREAHDFSGNTFDRHDIGTLLFRGLFSLFEVMTALGLCMICSSWWLPLFQKIAKKKFIINHGRILEDEGNEEEFGTQIFGVLLFILSFLISNIGIVMAQNEKGNEDLSNPIHTFPHFPAKTKNFGEFLGRVFLFPGTLFSSWEIISYPVIPWIGICFLGFSFGYGFSYNPQKTYKSMPIFGVIFFTSFCFIRGFGGEMNFRGNSRGEISEASDFMTFFIQTKYPPDWAYATITLSVCFFLIYIFACFEEKFVKIPPLLIFGKTPMFFYITHQWLIQVSEAICRIPKHPTGKFRTEKYEAFKSKTHPDSLWRMF